MCGICGKISFTDEIVDRGPVAAMCDTIVHRGPDGRGIYTAPHVGLGQRRLSIIDLRAATAEPVPAGSHQGTGGRTRHGKADVEQPALAFLFLELWFREFID